LGTLFLIFGIALYTSADSVIEIVERYDDRSDCKASGKNPTTCSFTIDVDDDMKEPIFVYYQLTNFF
jgi:hypothetical protein